MEFHVFELYSFKPYTFLGIDVLISNLKATIYKLSKFTKIIYNLDKKSENQEQTYFKKLNNEETG